METPDKIITLACNLTGANEQQLFSTNQENYVDTRALIFTALSDLGMTDTEIATRYHISRQSVNKLRNGFRLRLRKWSVRQAYKTLKRSLP